MKNSLELKHHGDDSDTCVNDSYGDGFGDGYEDGKGYDYCNSLGIYYGYDCCHGLSIGYGSDYRIYEIFIIH